MKQIVRLVIKYSAKECEMCNATKIGGRWEYRNYQYIPNHLPKILLICEKCIYRENYGSKYRNKAMKKKLLNKLNYNFGNKIPGLD